MLWFFFFTSLIQNTFLMYLDIGANASAVNTISASYVKTLTAGAKFPIGVDFATTDLIGTAGGETLGVVLIPTDANPSGNTASFEVNETAITFVSTYPSSTTLQYAFNVQKYWVHRMILCKYMWHRFRYNPSQSP